MAKSFLTSIDNMSLSDLDGESELIPLLTSEDEELLEKENLPDSIPILPLRNTVLFPGVVIPITASRDKAIELINDANKSDKKIGVVAQIDKNIDDPKPIDLYKIGTVAKILRVLKMPDGNITVIIQGKKRFKIDKFLNKKPYLTASIQNIKEDSKLKKSKEFNLIIESIKDLALKIINENPGIPTEASFAIKNIQGPSFLINFVSSNMNLKVTDKQHILSLSSIEKRAMTCLKFLNVEYKKLELKNDIQSRVKHDIDKQQREYYLYVPENLQPNAPLVFALHGYWGDASDMLGLFEEQADEHGFVVCYPTGLQDNFGTNHWNANFNEVMSTVDDIGFLSNLALKLHEDYDLSPEKTFSCGMSNGGFMSWSLACNAPSIFKAIASVTGTMSGPDWQNCNPTEMIPVMQISGTADNVVPMDGSMQYIEEGWGGAPNIYVIMDYWSDLHGCSNQETINFGFDYSTDVTQYFSCTSNTSTELRLYVANGMDHIWPDFADEQIWDFYMQIAALPLKTNDEVIFEKELIRSVDILGRETKNNGFKIDIFKDGSVKKQHQL